MASATATEPIVSHGRGGAGNINPDDTQYVDGEVTRTGVEGSHNDGAYSTGRGGAANIGDAGTKAAAAGRADKESVPEAALRPSSEGDFHVGRGGAGNEHVAEKKAGLADDHPKGLADKLKDKLMGVFKK
ncbi:hypothetical protein GGTG_06354 [Gaeumannomyces tritici R3-111a-1]|uniref:Uncharacterized protein n=1 Tax=Gaeumannomyces tritici (strain R3-111a-1) TaxID=644352 RepID=J3NYK2_GAET3|nr:hypothetical protein GGTG_06354 [Gaeumannomyces tritici R3-111a-1]EJT76435.1 hypothetical protein GGTG_06354 [Gaeumannomyces tritici R3-111a-1]